MTFFRIVVRALAAWKAVLLDPGDSMKSLPQLIQVKGKENNLPIYCHHYILEVYLKRDQLHVLLSRLGIWFNS